MDPRSSTTFHNQEQPTSSERPQANLGSAFS
jgi:hypothetical protein